MISYPVNFNVEADSQQGIETIWNAQCGNNENYTCAIPKEFEGLGDGASPEDFFALALSNCLIATFKVYAHHSKLSFEKLNVKSNLVVDKDEKQRPVMKECHMEATLSGASNPELGKRLLQRALDSGFVLNSVKTKLNLEIIVI